MLEKIKTIFMWIGAIAVAIITALLGRGLFDHRRGAERVRDNIDESRNQNQSAQKNNDKSREINNRLADNAHTAVGITDEIRGYNRDASAIIKSAKRDNKRATEIIRRIRERGTGEVNDDYLDNLGD